MASANGAVIRAKLRYESSPQNLPPQMNPPEQAQ
jgi:hypothetical protein